MSGFDALRKVLDAEQLRDLEGDYARFRERTGSADRDLFVQYLAQQGLLDAEQLRQALRVRGLPEVTELRALWSRFDTSGSTAQRTFATTSPEGRYALLADLGEGSMGRVHIGKDHDLKRKVAFKEISGTLADEPRLVRRFLHEVQITAQLDHPGVVPVYGLEVSREGRIGYAMKLIEGQTLHEVVAEAREQAERRAGGDGLDGLNGRLEHLLKVCDAIAYAHARGVIHRDLKPENIMVGRYGEAYVMDWGLARLMDDKAEDTGLLNSKRAYATQMGHAVGTPAYMAPEQAQGRNSEVGFHSDIYALGLVLQELITLNPALSGATGEEVLAKAARGERGPMVHVAGQRLPPGLHAVVAKACARSRRDRYPSVDALALDLRRYLRGSAPRAYDEPLFARLARMAIRQREFLLVLLLLMALGAGAMAVGSGVLLQLQRWESDSRQERLAATLTQVATQAHLIDAELARYERLLEAAGSAAIAVLSESEPEPDAPIYLAEGFDDPALGPSLVHSERYRMPVSFEAVSFKLGPGVQLDSVEPQVARLVRLRHLFRRLMLRTVLDGSLALNDRQLREVLGERGHPVAWMFVGTEEGVHVSFPGHGGYPEDYDPRERPWYRLSEGKRGVMWGNPYVDMNGMGLTLPVSTALYDPQGNFLGVAGLDLMFDYIISDLLASPLAGARESYLLDDQGRVVVRSSDALRPVSAGIGGGRILVSDPFDVPEVVEVVKERRSGYALTDAGELVVFYRLHALGWYYAVRGSQAEILEAD